MASDQEQGQADFVEKAVLLEEVKKMEWDLADFVDMDLMDPVFVAKLGQGLEQVPSAEEVRWEVSVYLQDREKVEAADYWKEAIETAG